MYFKREKPAINLQAMAAVTFCICAFIVIIFMLLEAI